MAAGWRSLGVQGKDGAVTQRQVEEGLSKTEADAEAEGRAESRRGFFPKLRYEVVGFSHFYSLTHTLTTPTLTTTHT